MATLNPSVGARSDEGGGEQIGGGDGGGGEACLGDDVEFCGSSNPPVRSISLPGAGAAAAAAVWKAGPTGSHHWTTAHGGVDLDDAIWEVRFNLDGGDKLERTLGRSDITYLNLLALIETEGYGICDSMYYVREEGLGSGGMELIDSMAKINEMLAKYEDKQCVSITVIKGRAGLGAGINRNLVEKQIPISQIGDHVVYSVNGEGVVFQSQNSAQDSEYLYLCTQQSNTNTQKKDKQVVQDEAELSQKIIQLKRKRGTEDPFEQRGDALDVEELFYNSDNDSENSDCIIEPELKKREKNPGPTTRSHHDGTSSSIPDYVPSSGEDTDQYGDLGSDDDDHFEALSFVLPKGVKSRAKKKTPRIWYDEQRLQPEEQLCLRMCFVDVYQFRRAVQQLHIAQLRNFRLHRNCKDRVIIKCKEASCKFYMTGSKIAGEQTFCLRKLRIEHTCGPSGEGCKINAKWVAKTCEQDIRTDPTTKVGTVIDNAKVKFGVAVPLAMAYRAKNEAIRVVLGDHIKQYTRLRDYLQTVIDTNPGSRCIVTTKVLPENPSPNPIFHGMFMCLGASIEGFLKGCRPFIGLDGCFVKLTTGQQILAATGRDGNNNIYPLAFGLVEREDKASWCWFLTQLKYAIGGESGQFGSMTGIPCSHAISAIYKSKQHPEDFVHDFFKKQMYLEAYKPIIYPVPGEDLWTKTNTPDIDPPEFKVEQGRKQQKRRKGKFEPPAPKVTSRMGSITCSNCKLVGHRYTNCTVPLNPSLQNRKNQHQENRASDDATSHAPTPTVASSSSAAKPPRVPAAGRSSSARPAYSAPTATPAPAQAPAPARSAFIAPRAAPPAARASTAAPAPPPPARAAPPAARARTTAPPPLARASTATPPPPRASTAGVRPVRKRKVPEKLNGYFTASRIAEKSVEELQNEGR